MTCNRELDFFHINAFSYKCCWHAQFEVVFVSNIFTVKSRFFKLGFHLNFWRLIFQMQITLSITLFKQFFFLSFSFLVLIQTRLTMMEIGSIVCNFSWFERSSAYFISA